MERVWLSRMRWRLRGGAQWPAFGLLVVADAALLHALPAAGSGPDWVQAWLLSVLCNLLVVATLAPLAGRLLRRRRGDLPAIVADDYAGTLLLGALTLVLLGMGLAHRAALRADHEAFAAQSAAVRRYVARQAPAEFRRNVDRANSVSFGADLYRTCVPGDRPDRALCLFVHTDQSPPGVDLDPNPAPNATYGPSPR